MRRRPHPRDSTARWQTYADTLKIEAEHLTTAAREVDAAWNAWMTDEDGEGQDRMEQAIARLRETLA